VTNDVSQSTDDVCEDDDDDAFDFADEHDSVKMMIAMMMGLTTDMTMVAIDWLLTDDDTADSYSKPRQ